MKLSDFECTYLNLAHIVSLLIINSISPTLLNVIVRVSYIH